MLTVTLDEPPPPEGVVGGTAAGDSDHGLNPAIDSITRPAAPKPVVEAAPTVPKLATKSPTPQIRVGGAVQAARLVHRVDPVYPAMARQMRIAGTVELAGVIGTDGRIRELRVTSGHPLLVQAALEAVRQWVYRPTLLGGQPVEVITTITVVFRLS
jgi:periplasmic protein TonB